MIKIIKIIFPLAGIPLLIPTSVPLISAAFYQPAYNANLEILPANISLQPARPGEKRFVNISFKNYGKISAENIN